MPRLAARQIARRTIRTTALSLVASAFAAIAVLTTFSTEAHADAVKQGGAIAQVLADQSKPMAHPAQPKPAAAKHAQPHATANAKAKAQPHPKAKAKATKSKPHAKPTKAPAKPAKPTPTARA